MRRQQDYDASQLLAYALAEVERLKALTARITDGRQLVVVPGTGGSTPSTPTSTHVLYGSKHTKSLHITAGAGLSVNYEEGHIYIDETYHLIGSGNLAGLADDTTNYVFVSHAGVVAANATGFPADCVPLAVATTVAGVVTNVSDQRAYLYGHYRPTFDQVHVGDAEHVFWIGEPVPGTLVPMRLVKGTYSPATGSWEEYNRTSDTWTWYTAGNQVFLIDPEGKIQIAGTSQWFLGLSAGVHPIINFDTNDYLLYIRAENKLALQFGGDERFYFTVAGAGDLLGIFRILSGHDAGGNECEIDFAANCGAGYDEGNLDINCYPAQANGPTRVNLFRETNTTGNREFRIFRGNNSDNVLLTALVAGDPGALHLLAEGSLQWNGPARFGSAGVPTRTLEIDDANFNLRLNGVDADIQMDTGDDIFRFNRTLNEFIMVIGGNSHFIVGPNGAYLGHDGGWGGGLTIWEEDNTNTGGWITLKGAAAFNDWSIDTRNGLLRFRIGGGLKAYIDATNFYIPTILKNDDLRQLTTGGLTIVQASEKLGFFGTAPIVRTAAYTPTNRIDDRAYDCDATTVAELADVLATVIYDLQQYGLLQ